MADPWDEAPIYGGTTATLDQPMPAMADTPEVDPWDAAPIADFDPGKRLAKLMGQMRDDPRVAKVAEQTTRTLYVTDRLPLVGSGFQAVRNINTAAAAKRINDDTASDRDYVDVAYYLVRSGDEAKRDFGGKVFDTVSAIPGFAAEIALTGGAYGLVKTGLQKAGTKALGKTAETMAGKLAVAATSRAAGVAAQTALLPTSVARSASERAMPTFKNTVDPEGNTVNVQISDDDKSFVAALPAGFLDTAIEIGSERAGTKLAQGASYVAGKVAGKLPYAKQIQAAKKMIVDRWLAKPGRTPAMLQETFKRVGWDGIVGESFEERAGDVSRLATGLESPDENVTGQLAHSADLAARGTYNTWDNDKYFNLSAKDRGRLRKGHAQLANAKQLAGDAGKQLAVETIAFGLLGAGAQAASAAGNVVEDHVKGKRNDEAWAKPEAAKFMVDKLLKEGKTPEQVRELAANPTSNAFEGMGLGSRKDRTMPGVASRRAFGENAAKHLDSMPPVGLSPETSQPAAVEASSEASPDTALPVTDTSPAQEVPQTTPEAPPESRQGELVQDEPAYIYRDGKKLRVTVSSRNDDDGWRVKGVKLFDDATGRYEFVEFPADAASGFASPEQAKSHVLDFLSAKYPQPNGLPAPSPQPNGLPAPSPQPKGLPAPSPQPKGLPSPSVDFTGPVAQSPPAGEPSPLAPRTGPPIDKELASPARDRETGLRNLQQYYGKPVESLDPTTPEEHDAAKFLKQRGYEPVFVRAADGSELEAHGARQGKAVFIRSGQQGKALWDVVGHEVAHASGFDVNTKADDALIDAYSERHMAIVPERFRKKMQSDPQLKRREGVAKMVGEFMQDPAFRAQLKQQSPTLWERLRDTILKVIGKFTPRDKAMREAIAALRADTVAPTVDAPKSELSRDPRPSLPGHSTTITAGDQQYPSTYAVMSLEDLTPSHDFWHGSPGDNVAAGKYPPSLQPRDYRDPAESAKVRDRSVQQQAHYFLEDTQRADGGPPSVSRDGIVFNGNGRAMMLQMAAGDNRYDWYKDALREKAASFGIDPARVDSLKHPVLVRQVDIDPTSAEGSAFAAAGNVTATQAQSPIRTAASLARLIDADLLDSGPVPDDATLSDVVGSGRIGREFRELIRGALPPSVVPAYFDNDGNLTDGGKELVRDMLLTKVLPVEIVEKFLATRKALAVSIEKALPALLRMTKGFPKLFESFHQATAMLAENAEIRTVPDLRAELDQKVLFGEKRKMNTAAKMLAAFMLRDGHKSKVFTGKLTRMMNDLQVTGKGGLFASETSSNSPVDVAAEALDVEPAGKELYAGKALSNLRTTATLPVVTQTSRGNAADWSRSPAETPKGRALVRAIERDSTTKPTVGIRSISEFLIRGMHSVLIVTSGQVTRKHPAHFKPGTAAIMTTSGAISLDYHEAAHALSFWLKDRHGNWYRKISAALKAFSEVAPHASAKSAEEGLAEVGRYYVQDQSAIPPRLLESFERILAEKNPQALAVFRDAHRAHQALIAKPIGEFLAALNNDRGPKASYLSSALTWLYGMGDLIIGNNVTVDYAERKTFRGILTAEKATSDRRTALAKAREFRREMVNTPGSVRAAYHARLAATGGAVRALGGEGDVQGIRVRLWGKFASKGHGRIDTTESLAGFARFDAETLEALRDAGFEIPENAESRHGYDLQLFDKSVQQVREIVGEKEWPAFANWKQYQVTLERWTKTDADFPGMYEGKLNEIKQFVKDGAKNPKWAEASETLNQFFRQMLLMNVLSGQTTPAEAIRIAGSYEHYAPLYRVQEEFDASGSGNSKASPSAPLRRQFGSLRQFENLDDNINQYVRQTFAAYYDQVIIDAVLYESRLAGANKELPYEFRTLMEQTLIPLKLEKKKAATAHGGELAPAIADAINRMNLKQLGGRPDGMESKEVADQLQKLGGEPVFSDDINVAVPGLPIYRNTSPRQHRVIARWENGEREYMLVTDPVMFNLFSAGKIAGQDSPFLKLVARVLNGFTQPWKRAIVHAPKFAVRSLVRDPWAGLWYGQTLFNRKGTEKASATTTAEDWIPAASLIVGTLQQVFSGSLDVDARAAMELARKSLDMQGAETFGRAWRTPGDVVRSFSPSEFAATGWEVLKEGIAPPASWATASTAERMADMPGMAMSAALKPVDIAWWLLGSRRFASWQETTPRVRAYQRSAQEGLSPAENQVPFDSITGLFAARPSNEMLWQFYRAAGFVNPFLQTFFQNIAIMTHPDPAVRNVALAVRLPYFAVLGAGAAALSYALRAAMNGDDDKWKKNISEQGEKERNSHFDVFGFRLPFPHGIEGAAFSIGWNTTMDSMLNNPVDAQDRAQRVVVHAADMVGIEDFTQPHLKTSFELVKDWSYHLEKSIVPQALRERYPDNPEMWVRPDTPEVYKQLAAGAHVSPLQVQYAVRNGIAAQYDDLLTWLEGSGENPITKGMTYGDTRYYRSRSIEQLERLDKQYNAIHQELSKRAEKEPAAAKQLQRLEVAHRVNLEVDRLVGQLHDAKADGRDAEANRIEQQVIDVARHFVTKGQLHPAIVEHATQAESKALKRGVKLGKQESPDAFEDRKDDNQYRQQRAQRVIDAGS